MTKKTEPPPPLEAEAVPLAVITRAPSDDELLAELTALLPALESRAVRTAEYDHARVKLAECVDWIRKGIVATST